jgi:hypothetical protein
MWREQSEWEEIIKTAIEKIERGGKLGEEELRALACEVEYANLDEIEHVTEIEGEDHRWQREVSAVIKAHGRYWRIDWMRALTETSENDFWDQPVEVRPVTRTIPAREVIEYEAICDSE